MSDVEVLGYAILALLAASLGALGGIGGALLLVPALVLTGMPPTEAAPLGMVSVAAGSIAAGAPQLRERAVNHRIGVVTELAAVTGAVVGAIMAGLISERALVYVLAGAAAAGAFFGLRPMRAATSPPAPHVHRAATAVGERVGGLAGAYPNGGVAVAYVPRRLPAALGLMTVAGLVAGTAGTSGGFLKTPTETAVMGLPMRVAAATTTFTVGITASAAVLVFAIDGRLDVHTSSAVVAGSLVGGQVGAGLQRSLSDRRVRLVLSVLLLVSAVMLVVRA